MKDSPPRSRCGRFRKRFLATTNPFCLCGPSMNRAVGHASRAGDRAGSAGMNGSAGFFRFGALAAACVVGDGPAVLTVQLPALAVSTVEVYGAIAYPTTPAFVFSN